MNEDILLKMNAGIVRVSLSLLPYALSICLVFLWILYTRRRTRLLLSSGACNLPTVTWTPRFLNYIPSIDECITNDDNNALEIKNRENTSDHSLKQQVQDKNKKKNIKNKMPSSNITNILPRMERLGGPYGMYATVYGVSTKVVHVAHPIPARLILTGATSSSNSNRRNRSPEGNKVGKKDSFTTGSGATKMPAYDHFKNFSGDGVFTADGRTWKDKRASVLHSLLRGCTKENSSESRRLENEANRAADSFLLRAFEAVGDKIFLRNRNEDDTMYANATKEYPEKGEPKKEKVNIVPILQRSTIGLIYRLITHHDVDMYEESASPQRKEIVESNSSAIFQGIEEYETEIDKDIDSDSSAASSSTARESSESSLSDTIYSSSKEYTSEKAANSDTPTIQQSVRNTKTINSYSKHKSQPPSKLLTSYLNAVTNIRMIILAQSRSIWFLLPRWAYRIFSSMYRTEEKVMESIRDFARNACYNSQPGSPLAMLRERTSHNPTLSEDVKSGDVISKEMMDEAITLLFAGQDTTAATLSWTLHLLSLNPSVQRRLAEEVSSILEQERECTNSTTRHHTDYQGRVIEPMEMYITKKMVGKMTYLDAVIKESMRLYPVAPFVVRKLPEDMVIPAPQSGGESITLPADTFACIWIYSLHRNDKLWHKAHNFIPERWIDPNLRQLDAAQESGAFMPFAAGPRNCLGQPLAHVILRIMLAKIVNECEVIDERASAIHTKSLMNIEGDSSSVDDENYKKEKTKREEDFVRQTMVLRKDMQAGFTVLPVGGVKLSLYARGKS